MVNLNQLRFFCELARKNSFSKAAEACYVTQPTLSNSIALLEESLEGKLFNRSTRHVSLTAFGQHLLPLAEAVLTAQEEFVGEAKAFKNPRHKLLRIGLSPLIDMQLLAEILQPFKEQHPDLEVFFKECFLDDLAQRMEDETIDIAIMPKRESHIHYASMPFYSEPLFFLPCDRGNGSRQEKSALVLSDIVDETLILTIGGCGLRDAIKKIFRKEGLKITEYTGQAVSYKVVEDWAGLGIGAGILPKSKLSPGNDNVQALLQDKETEAMIKYDVTYSRHIEHASHVSEFLQYIKEVVPQLIQGRVA